MKLNEVQVEVFTYDNGAMELETVESSTELHNLERMNDGEIQQWRDHRGFSLLMIAAETGKSEVVNHLIEKGEDLDFEVEGQTAASLAFNNGHHGIVISLVKANAKYPNNYNHEEASDELKAFVNLSEEMHERVRNCDEEVEESLNGAKSFLILNAERFPSLRHFYDFRSISLLRTAIFLRMFEIYKILLMLNIFLGKHESVDDIMSQLSTTDQRRLRNINEELSTNIFTDEMMILMRNCKLGPGVTDHGFYIEFIRKAFDFLFRIPTIETILKVVAARRNFKIIFDFKRDSVQFLDPSAEPYTNGLCYLGGRIYIGAMDMLDLENAHKVYAVMAHELCHYAMFLVYENDAKPYREAQRLITANFEGITEECRAVSELEECISSVFNDYPEEMFYAELIVRVPQMLVTYFHDQIFLNLMRGTFLRLFEFYELNVVSEMEREMPKLQKKFGKNKKVQKLERSNILLITIILLMIPISIMAIIYVYSPTLTWSSLTDKQKLLFKNATVNFYGIEVKFGELFADNSEIYEKLRSEEIKFGLDGKSLELSKALHSIYNTNIFLNYSNMTERLRTDFVKRKLNFQGKNVEIKKILKNFETLKSLSSSQIRETFEGNLVKISSETATKLEFYVERFFLHEEIKIDYRVHYRFGIIDKDQVISFEQILRNIKWKKVFLLSSPAGEGKSTTLRNFALKLKEKNPENWIQFVDLKKHFEAFEKGLKINLKNSEELIKFLTLNLLKLNELESEIFKELLNLNRVTFLWDGIDEISPLYKDFMLDLSSTLKKTLKCSQFISTRPQFLEDFAQKLEVKAYKLLQFGKRSRFEFLVKFLTSEINLNSEEIWGKLKENETKIYSGAINSSEILHLTKNEKFASAYGKAQKVLNIIEKKLTGKFVNNPILLQMICEISESDENFDENFSLNWFEIYETFIDKKLKIVRNEKGEIVGKDLDKILKNSKVNLMQVHQAYALKLIVESSEFKEDKYAKLNYARNLTIMKEISKLPNFQISRFGILEIFSEENFDFAHRTFAEFFVAKYLIENFDTFDLENPDTDSELKIFLFNSVLFSEKFEGVKQFMFNFIKAKNEQKIFDVFQSFPKFPEFLRNISSLKFFEETFSELKDKITVNVLNFYDEYKEKVDQRFQMNSDIKNQFLLSKTYDTGGLNVLHQVFFLNYNHKILGEILETLNTQLNENEIKKLILEICYYCKHFRGHSIPLMIAAWKGNETELSSFWNFIKKIFNESEIKEILLIESRDFWTALQHSTKNQNPSSFLFMKKIYEEIFTQEEIREILVKNHQLHIPNFIYDVIHYASFETAQEVSKFLEKLFKNQKAELRKFLSSRDFKENSIFSSNKDQFSDNSKIFIKLLRKTFEVNQEEEFNAYFMVLRTQARINIKSFTNVKEILLSKNEQEENFLYELFVPRYDDRNEKLIESYLEKIQKELNKSEILTLIFTQESEKKRNSLMSALIWKKLKYVKILWNFLEKNLNEVERKTFLLLKDQDSRTALQYSTWNKDHHSFLFMKNVYEFYLTQEEVREILMKGQILFLDEFWYASFETAQEVSKFLEKLFKSQKIELRKILSHHNEGGHSIFSVFKSEEDNEEKLKILIDLLRKTFDENQEEEFEKSLNGLQKKL